MTRLELQALPGRYAVCRLAPSAPEPLWAQGGAFISLSRTPDELSVICDEHRVPDGVTSERGFRCLRVVGPLAFSETGVLASLAQPLAEVGISIFAVSTFDADYLLVSEPDWGGAMAALAAAGHGFTEVA